MSSALPTFLLPKNDERGLRGVVTSATEGETVSLDAALTANRIRARPAQLNFSRHPFIQFLYIHSASRAKGAVQWL
jgi:hypothetical protein